MENSLDDISIIKEENNIQNNDEINFRKNIMNKEDIINFDKSLELSNIENIDDKINKKNKNDENNNINILNDISDYSLINYNNNIINNNKNIKNKNKITKEEMNNIPLPIFSCIYCCDEKISFKHLSNEIISKKYLYVTSIHDMILLENLISGKNTNKINNNKLLNIILNNFEALKKYYNKDNIYKFFKTKKFGKKCEKNENLLRKKFRIKIEEKVNKKKKDFYFKEIKGMYKISKNSLNNKCLFNTNSIINNYSSLAGLIPANSEFLQNLAEKKNNSLSNSQISNLNIQNNSKSWKKNEIGLIGKDNNKHYVENIVKNIDKNVESDILDFLGENDLKRKINKKDIEWEESYYDINKPIIDDDNIYEEDINNITNLFDNKNNKNRNKINNLNINFDNMINNNNYSNNLKHISINSENKSNSINIKISLFNNSKSLTSTNTSSNIILKEKDNNNKTLSIFLNKNKIFNSENNSILSPRYNNLEKKSEKKINKNMPSPPLTKNKIGSEINAKRFTKLFNNNGNSCSDLKNIHKKILFNHTLNINRDIYGYKNIKNNNPINLDIKTNKIKFIEKLELKDNKDILNTNKNSINFNRGNMSSKNYNRYKLLLTNNKNKENTNNQKEEKERENNNFLDKMIKRFKSNKENNIKQTNFNSVFKFKKSKENTQTKSPINNIKYSLILSHKNNKDKKINVFNFTKKDFIRKNIENDYMNNLVYPGLNKKENNFYDKKFITENNSYEKSKSQSKKVNYNYIKNNIKIIS